MRPSHFIFPFDKFHFQWNFAPRLHQGSQNPIFITLVCALILVLEIWPLKIVIVFDILILARFKIMKSRHCRLFLYDAKCIQMQAQFC